MTTASNYYKKIPARGPVSEMAVKLASAVHDASISGLEGADLLTIPRVLDAELQEVREVFDKLRSATLPDGPCWCPGEHPTYDCQRARALMEKLNVK